MSNSSDTRSLLSALHGGDTDALAEILRRHLPWIQHRARMRLGANLRWKAETDDIVQDAVAEFLRYGPRCLLADERQLRALLARIVENVLRDENDRWRADRRAIDRERPVPSDSVIDLDRPVDSVTTPSEAASRIETRDWVRLALEFLDPDERRIIQAREIEDRGFRECAELFGSTEEAARMRFNRALARLASVVRTLQTGRLASLLPEA